LKPTTSLAADIFQTNNLTELFHVVLFCACCSHQAALETAKEVEQQARRGAAATNSELLRPPQLELLLDPAALNTDDEKVLAKVGCRSRSLVRILLFTFLDGNFLAMHSNAQL
jgi:hypothetical protein